MAKKHSDNISEGLLRGVFDRRRISAYIAVIMLTSILVCAVSFVKEVVFEEPIEFNLEEYLATATLVWSDEFDGDTLDETKWFVEGSGSPDNRFPRRGGYWSADAVSIADGNLEIEIGLGEDDEFYSGAVTTHGRYPSKYGYYEIRCILPKAYGIWSAFWMMPSVGKYFSEGVKDATIAGAEIDIMEAPAYALNLVQQNVHVGGYGTNHASFANIDWLLRDCGDIYDNFHTYGVYWSPQSYVFTVDGIPVWGTRYDGNVSGVEQDMIISVEVGGTVEDGVPKVGSHWGPTMTRPDDKRNDWSTPVKLVVDYVRHWKNVG